MRGDNLHLSGIVHADILTMLQPTMAKEVS